MEPANTSFTFDGVDMTIPCSIKDKMRDICQKYCTKIEKNINSLVFLYKGSLLNFDLSFEQQANSMDKQRKKMQVLVYKNESYAYLTKSEQEINSTVVKIEDIIKSIDDIKNKINGAKYFRKYY